METYTGDPAMINMLLHHSDNTCDVAGILTNNGITHAVKYRLSFQGSLYMAAKTHCNQCLICSPEGQSWLLPDTMTVPFTAEGLRYTSKVDQCKVFQGQSSILMNGSYYLWIRVCI